MYRDEVVLPIELHAVIFLASYCGLLSLLLLLSSMVGTLQLLHSHLHGPYLLPLISSPPFLWNYSALAAMNPLCHCTYFPVAGIQESFALCCGKGHGFLCFCWETHVHYVPSLLWPFKEIPCCCSASWRPSQCAVSPSETSSTSHRLSTVLLSIIGVGRHRDHVQQRWTLMWVPPPYLNLVYIFFSINHES